MNRTLLWVVPVVVLAAAAGGYFFWQQMREVELKPEPPRVEAPPAAPAPAEPQIRHPIEQARPQAQEQATETASLPPLGESDKLVEDALTGLLGADSVRAFLNVDDF